MCFYSFEWVVRFFFFKQKTAYELRISDWSSDVCSSDLVNYTDGNVIQIRSAFRTATQIEFAPGEVIKFVAMGDTVSWEVDPADNSLFVKPRERAGATNLIVVTDFQGTKRNYTFELSTVAAADRKSVV